MIQEYFKDCMNEEQLRQRHRELVVKMHPDKNLGNPNATAEFQEMQAQYEERLAELHGDYSKSRKGWERRQRYEQEQREREERERKEREQRRFEEVITQARHNKGVDFRTLKAGDYVYARKVNATNDMYEWDYLHGGELLHVAMKKGVADETVVKIEAIVDVTDFAMVQDSLSWLLSHWSDDIFGGWETIQQANPMGGVPKTRKVAKVVMFKSDHYCMFGNPMGDHVISDYYVPCDYEAMFSDELHILQAEAERERLEAERKEQERMARLLAEQQPMIDEWQSKLITISAALTDDEKQRVAVENLKIMFKAKFPGVKFKMRITTYDSSIKWTDGPTLEEAKDVCRMFDYDDNDNELTPWQQRYGSLCVSSHTMREMSTITKATILQQLGQITDAFATSGYDDEVVVSDFDWKMLHLMVGINVDDTTERLCRTNGRQLDGRHIVEVRDAVQYVFDHTSYVKARKKKAAKQAA